MFLGIGARSGVPEDEFAEAVRTLGVTGFAAVATVDRRGPLLEAFAGRRGWPLMLFTDAEVAMVRTPHLVARTGAPSVAEACALLAAGPGSRLVVPKRVFARVTVALAVAAACR